MIRPRLRKPRFERCPDAPGVVLTQRDICILLLVNRHRLIRSDHLVHLVQGSRQHLTRRLGRLFHAGYVDRPHAQRQIQRPFNSHFAYALISRGQRELQRRGFGTFAGVPKLHAPASAFSLSHTLRVTDTVVAFERGAAAQGLRFISHHEWSGATKPESSRLRHLHWFLRFKHEGRAIETSVVPDAAFSIESRTGGPSYFLLEADRGTMPVARRYFTQSSFLRKIVAYKETRRAGVLWKRFEVSGFRVLIVVESARRLASLKAATAACFKGGESGMFLFAVTDEFLSSPDPLAHSWQTCSGKRVPLLPSQPLSPSLASRDSRDLTPHDIMDSEEATPA